MGLIPYIFSTTFTELSYNLVLLEVLQMHMLKTNTILNNLKKQSILKTILFEIELPSCIWPICYSISP